MATGYTVGIIDGTIKSFKEFAKKCMRNFGALVHMRDDPWNAEYKKPTVDNYLTEAIIEQTNRLEKLKSISDDELLAQERKKIEESIADYTSVINDKLEKLDILNEYLQKAKDYEPPTIDHYGIKEFMIQQLEDTIKYDCSTGFYERSIEDAQKLLNQLDAFEIRKERREDLMESIEYYKERLLKQTEQIGKSDKWVMDFLKSLQQYDS